MRPNTLTSTMSDVPPGRLLGPAQSLKSTLVSRTRIQRDNRVEPPKRIQQQRRDRVETIISLHCSTAVWTNKCVRYVHYDVSLNSI